MPSMRSSAVYMELYARSQQYDQVVFLPVGAGDPTAGIQ